jgi:hypothetical protein
MASIVRKAMISASLVLGGLLAAPPGANAQEPSHPFRPSTALTFVPMPPPLVAPTLLPPGEPTGEGGGLGPFLASQPLRLSLVSLIPLVGGGFDQCRRSDINNDDSGAPLQRYQFVPLAPHLVLHGFSIGGCTIDAGLGAGFTYDLPLGPSTWLVAGAGAYGVPARDVALPARWAADLRLDLVKKTDSGQTFRWGVVRKDGTRAAGGAPMVTFGGGF